MSNPEDLYKGFPKEKAAAYRAEAIAKWGAEAVERSEAALLKRSPADLEALKLELETVSQQLFEVRGQPVEAPEVQALISRHYQVIAQFWGKTPSGAAYKGLGELYVSDDRYTTREGVPQPEYAAFLSRAMAYFVEQHLPK